MAWTGGWQPATAFYLVYAFFSTTSYEDVTNVSICNEGADILPCVAHTSSCAWLDSTCSFPQPGEQHTHCGRSLNCSGIQNLVLLSPLITYVTLETSFHLLAPGFFIYLKQNRLTVHFSLIGEWINLSLTRILETYGSLASFKNSVTMFHSVSLLPVLVSWLTRWYINWKT